MKLRNFEMLGGSSATFVVYGGLTVDATIVTFSSNGKTAVLETHNWPKKPGQLLHFRVDVSDLSDVSLDGGLKPGPAPGVAIPADHAAA